MIKSYIPLGEVYNSLFSVIIRLCTLLSKSDSLLYLYNYFSPVNLPRPIKNSILLK